MMGEEFSTSIWWPDSVGRKILPHVRNSLIHATTPHGLKGILKDGYIIPNDGRFRYSHTQSPSSFGGHNKWICVFDFAQATDEEIILKHDDWQWILLDPKELKFLLDIDREAIADYLIPNTVGQDREDHRKGYIPYVEAWITEKIPLSAVKGCLVTRYLPDVEKVEIYSLDIRGACSFS